MGVTAIKQEETCAETHHQMLKAYSFKSNSREAAATILQMNTVSWVREFRISIRRRQAAMLVLNITRTVINKLQSRDTSLKSRQHIYGNQMYP